MAAGGADVDGALGRFDPLVAEWFTAAFAAPTAAQSGAWDAIGRGDHTLVVAPTGSGKTLAAFLSSINDLVVRNGRPDGPPEAQRKCSVLYLSPLKALAVDVERNLRSPLIGVGATAARRGTSLPEITVAVRSGDTSAADRRVFARDGADILITTPESLFLLLTSRAREMLTGITTVIIDEIHAVAGTKRGAHMAVSLDRLDALLDEPAQRVGLSATVRPVEEIGRFLTGGRPVTVVQPPSTKQIDVDVVVPVPDMSQLGQPSGDLTGRAAGEVPRTSIWPHVEERVVDLVEQHRSTIVFANSRRLAERLTARLNEIHGERLAAAEAGWSEEDDGAAGSVRPQTGPPAQVMAQAGVSVGAAPVLAKAHHGSVSREQRSVIEEELKTGKLAAVVATSSLELGIDMGAVDLVIQVESPPSVASGLQRIGRAGHQVGAASHGVMFPKFRGDLVSAAVVSRRMQSGAIEAISVISNPLDIAAQQIVAICAMDPITVDELHELLRRSAPFASLGRGALEAVLDMLSGRYPSEQFAELRPRITWDRVTGELAGRQGAQRLAVTSGGTIPDRGLYGVFLAGSEVAGGGGRRVGELDEEMVYESRVGDVFALGSSSWRIVDITHDQVLVVPAPGLPGKLPFWKGDTLGRPAELGRAHGEFVRDIGSAPREQALTELRGAGLDEFAALNLVDYLTEQSSATGVLPDEKTIVIERFRDELGDWRVVIHSPYGAAVHAPWSLVIAARMRERYGVDVAAMHADDGIVLRLPDVEYGGEDGSGSGAPPDFAEFLTLDPETVEAEVTAEIGGAAIFASRFRECAARALLLPRRQIGKRQPLWQQRQRASQLLEVASAYPSFPIVAEAVRECLSDVFDVPALVHLLTELRSRTVRVVEVTTNNPSPFASSLLFGYVAQFLYEGDSPLAERRAAALTVDPTLLAELLGRGDGLSLRDLLDPQALADTEAELQRLSENRQARNPDEISDLLRILGPLSTLEIDLRSTVEDVGAVLDELAAARRVVEVRVGGELRWADPTDAGVLRDALGTALPPGIAESFLERVPDPLARLLGRYARTHGPFLAAEAATRFGLGVAVVTDALRRMVGTGRLAEGEFRPLGREPEFLDAEVLRLLRRRSLAALRAEVEPVEPQALARFLPAWNGIGVRRGSQALRGVDGLVRAIEQLAGAQVPASALETLILPARVRGYTPALLDELTASGEVVWAGHGSLPGEDGWVSLHLAETVALTLPLPPEELMAALEKAAQNAPAEALSGPSTGAEEAERGSAARAADDSAWGWVHRAILEFLGGGGAHFFRPIVDAVVGRGVRDVQASGAGGQSVDGSSGSRDGRAERPLLGSAAYPTRAGGAGTPLVSDGEIAEAVWDLVFAGLITSDTLAPLRARLSGGRTTHKTARAAPRARQRGASGLSLLAAGRAGRAAAAPRRVVTPPSVAGRWSMLPAAETDLTIRTAAAAEVLLDRHGIVTRGAVVAEGVPGGFAGVYRVLAALEETGRIRRGYFVEGLGAAQFAGAGAVDRVRAYAGLPGREPGAEPDDDWSGPPPGSFTGDPVAAAGFDVDIELPGQESSPPGSGVDAGAPDRAGDADAGADSEDGGTDGPVVASVAAAGGHDPGDDAVAPGPDAPTNGDGRPGQAPTAADGFDDYDDDDDLTWPPAPPSGSGSAGRGGAARNGFGAPPQRSGPGPGVRHGVFGGVLGAPGRGGPGGQEQTGPTALVLAASDPVNPYGAALPWPGRTGTDDAADPTGRSNGSAPERTDRHRPARRAGAMVVLVDGALVLFAERGGRSLLSFTTDPDALAAGAEGLAGLVTGGTLPGLTMVKIDGVDAVAGAGPVIEALVAAGFTVTPRGVRLRRGPR